MPKSASTPVTGKLHVWRAVQGTLCDGVAAIPEGIGEWSGPITSWSLIVPSDSSQTSISAEAVYFIYGFGAALGQVAPWIVDAELYSRNATSAALIAIALAAGIPPTKFNRSRRLRSRPSIWRPFNSRLLEPATSTLP